MNNMNKASRNLFMNGIGFLERGAKILTAQMPVSETSIAFIHLSIGMELIFKHYLEELHWSLVFRDPKNASLDSWQKRDFHSVGFDDALDRLRRLRKTPFADKKYYEGFRTSRNMIEHLGDAETNLHELQGSAAKALTGLFLLIEDLSGDDLEQPEREGIREIRLSLTNFNRLIQSMIENNPQLQDQPPLVCRECSVAKMVFVSEGLACLWCDSRIDPEFAILMDGLTPPTDCKDCCSTHSTTVMLMADGYREVCLECGVFSDKKGECKYCHDYSGEADAPMCISCIGEITAYV